mmetsp:Transcript_44939/g.101072  ORF Transcript_44939/g.101072 Transcript_44939/m.101072 type:complete len:239 (-) Transcript_44939:151-867(-)
MTQPVRDILEIGQRVLPLADYLVSSSVVPTLVMLPQLTLTAMSRNLDRPGLVVQPTRNALAELVTLGREPLALEVVLTPEGDVARFAVLLARVRQALEYAFHAPVHHGFVRHVVANWLHPQLAVRRPPVVELDARAGWFLFAQLLAMRKLVRHPVLLHGATAIQREVLVIKAAQCLVTFALPLAVVCPECQLCQVLQPSREGGLWLRSDDCKQRRGASKEQDHLREHAKAAGAWHWQA